MGNIFEKLAAICQPQNITVGSDFISFDFTVNRADIYTGNLTPEQIRAINEVERIETRTGFLHGMNGRELIFECYASYWNAEEVKEHHQYFEDKSRNKALWEIDTNGFFILP